MTLALEEAHLAASEDEVPVGAVIVHDNKIIARSRNRNRRENNPVLHAEIIAIQEAAEFFNNERLSDCTLYVTKEPCAMCAGAIVHARITRVVIGTRDQRYGACGTVLEVCGSTALNHAPEIEFGILEEENIKLLKDFFKNKRKK